MTSQLLGNCWTGKIISAFCWLSIISTVYDEAIVNIDNCYGLLDNDMEIGRLVIRN